MNNNPHHRPLLFRPDYGNILLMLGIKKPLTKGSEVFAVMEVVTLRNTALQQGQPLIIE